jgi:hypothetical protein
VTFAGRLCCPIQAALLSLTLLLVSPAWAWETRGYVVSWFTTAMYSEDGDCPGGLNPTVEDLYKKIFRDAGKSPADVEKLAGAIHEFSGPAAVEAHDLITYRGRLNGKPVNVYQYPDSVPDPHIRVVRGRYALGFNLDSKGAASPNSFEDPYTHERGINNQLFRALGCFSVDRAKPPERPTSAGVSQWSDTRAQMPAWLISVSGDDLSKDGKVTVTFDRALKHAMLDSRGDTLAGASFQIDPDPRSHNVFQAELKGGVLLGTVPTDFHMMADPYFMPEFDITRARLRLQLKPDGTLDGILGGYQRWLTIYWGLADVGVSIENVTGVDYVGLYHALKNLADAEPDPKTGQNMRISAAYRVEAVRAFLLPAARIQAARAIDQSRSR